MKALDVPFAKTMLISFHFTNHADLGKLKYLTGRDEWIVFIVFVRSTVPLNERTPLECGSGYSIIIPSSPRGGSGPVPCQVLL